MEATERERNPGEKRESSDAERWRCEALVRNSPSSSKNVINISEIKLELDFRSFPCLRLDCSSPKITAESHRTNVHM